MQRNRGKKNYNIYVGVIKVQREVRKGSETETSGEAAKAELSKMEREDISTLEPIYQSRINLYESDDQRIPKVNFCPP